MYLVKTESGRGRRAWVKEGLPEKMIPDQNSYEPVTFYREGRKSD